MVRLTDGRHGCDCENETGAEERLQLLLQRLSCMIDKAKHTQQFEAPESRGVPCALCFCCLGVESPARKSSSRSGRGWEISRPVQWVVFAE